MHELGKITRREALKAFFRIAVAGGAALYGIDRKLEKFGKPEYKYYEFPERWLNPKGEPLPMFLSYDNGPEAYYRALIDTTPVVDSALAEVFRQWKTPPQHHPLLGEVITAHRKIAERTLTEHGYDPRISDTMRLSTITLACSSIFDPDLAGSISHTTNAVNGGVNSSGYYDIVVPNLSQVFPMKTLPGEPYKIKVFNRDGIDRHIHALTHGGMVFEFSRLSWTNSVDDILPYPLNKLLGGLNPHNEGGLLLSKYVGRGWEGIEGVVYPPWKVARGANDGVPTGPFDKCMTLDFAANRLGAVMGLFASRPDFSETDFHKLVEVACHSKVTKPIQNTWYPRVSLNFALPLTV